MPPQPKEAHLTLPLFLQRIHKLLGGLLIVSLGVVLGPLPQVGARILERQLRLPLELLVGERGVGRQVEHVALAALGDLVGEIAADDVAEGLDHVEDGGALAGAQVPGPDARAVLAQVVKRYQMALGQV